MLKEKGSFSVAVKKKICVNSHNKRFFKKRRKKRNHNAKQIFHHQKGFHFLRLLTFCMDSKTGVSRMCPKPQKRKEKKIEGDSRGFFSPLVFKSCLKEEDKKIKMPIQQNMKYLVLQKK